MRQGRYDAVELGACFGFLQSHTPLVSSNVFDIGFSELFLVAVIGLLVLGPERLAEVTKTAGALLRKLRKSWSAVQAEIESELATQDLKKNLIQPLEQIDEEARRGIWQVEQQIREAKQSATATGKSKLGKDTVRTSDISTQ